VFEIFRSKKAVLRQERSNDDYRYLGVEIKENGDLVFEGQDLGSAVEGAFGASEYEWYWTVKKADIGKLREAIGGKGCIIRLLKKHFSNDNAVGLYAFMEDHNVPFHTWSRIGD